MATRNAVPVSKDKPTTSVTKAAAGTSGTLPIKRKRLAKAFPLPLDEQRKKERVVREKFSLPKAEYARLEALKGRLADQGLAVKKSQLVRAGLILLAALADEDLREVVSKVPAK